MEASEHGRRPLRHRLAFRLALALCVGAAVIGVIAGLWNISEQRDSMEALVRVQGEGTVETIRRSTRDAMLRNEASAIKGILSEIGQQPGIFRLRYFDKEGRIKISSDQAEEGSQVDMQAEGCSGCHQGEPALDRLRTDDRVRLFRDEETKQRVIGITAAILNEPDCSTTDCHPSPSRQKVLGVLDVQLSLSAVDEHVRASERQIGLAVILTAAAILLLSGFLTWRMVLLPVRSFKRASERVADGDLSTRVRVTSKDEIGEMAASWNIMVEQLGRARRELEEWSHTLEHRVDEKTRELETAHRRMLLVEKMASLGKLAAVVAHEINNPLAGIGTYARLLRRRIAKKDGEGQPPMEEAETAKILELMESEATRCGEIVRNLLLFSRAPGVRFSEEDLGVLLERCVLLVNHQAELQEVKIELDVREGLPPLVCDASQIQQVVLALALNAIESMPSGGTLVIRARLVWEEAVLSVADTGCGISPENLSHIFEPFYTTKDQGKGVGLGLAVAYGIVTRHRGRIEVDSDPGKGTTFAVYLPLRQTSDPVGAADTLGEGES
jgi:two-component system NtrC family sensor kinase